MLMRGQRRSGTIPGRRGFSLVEVLVTVLVLAIGLLGIAGLQLKGMQFNHSAYVRSQATFLAYDLLDRMRSNREVAETSNRYQRHFGDAIGSYTDCAQNSCDETDLADYDIRQWASMVSERLPEGDAEVTFTNSGTTRTYSVDLRWRDKRLTQAQDSSANQSAELVHFVYKAEL